jgi:hypothetical protein
MLGDCHEDFILDAVATSPSPHPSTDVVEMLSRAKDAPPSAGPLTDEEQQYRRSSL